MKRAITLTSVALVSLGLAAAVHADETKGTIKSVDATQKVVVLKGILKDSTYELDKNATVWLDGARCKLGDLAADDTAVIDYRKEGDRMFALQVRGLRKAQETSGTVNDIYGDKREITLKGTIKNTTYELKKGGTVYVDGKAAALTDIRAGDQVLITYEARGDRLVANDVTVFKRK
jgi:formylmethanofuran dehydrogenase subunit C